MAFLHFNKKSFQFIATIATTSVVSSICFFSNSVSQASNASYPSQIRLGIRTTSSAIGSKNIDNSYGGFCGEFLNTLTQELSRQNQRIPVTGLDIANQYRGIEYPRYDGLISNKVEIECGPNSKSSLKLRDTRDRKPFREKIIFSRNNFHTTGIKLLLKKETAAELQSTPLNQLEDKLSKLPIAAIKGTTTLKEFRINKDFYKSLVPYPKRKQANQKLDVRDFALDDLEADKVKAFASDAIILRTLLEKGVKGEAGYRKDRQPLKNQNYVIYPPEPGKYLPNLGKQEYAIAINKNTPYVRWLKQTIDRVLSNANLSQAKQYVKEYEDGKYYASAPPSAVEAIEIDEKAEALEVSNRTESNKKDNPFFDPKFIIEFLTVAAPLIVAFAGLISAIAAWKNGKSEKGES
jgi:ABC-type amino acid transport substrate-binding protein